MYVLQERLLKEMILVGEAALARDYAVEFGLDPAVLQLDPAELAADEAARAATYLQLPLTQEAVWFVDTAERLAQAAPLLEADVARQGAASSQEAAASEEAAVLGLDCEWQARTERGRGSDSEPPVSLLQVILASSSKSPPPPLLQRRNRTKSHHLRACAECKMWEFCAWHSPWLASRAGFFTMRNHLPMRRACRDVAMLCRVSAQRKLDDRMHWGSREKESLWCRLRLGGTCLCLTCQRCMPCRSWMRS